MTLIKVLELHHLNNASKILNQHKYRLPVTPYLYLFIGQVSFISQMFLEVFGDLYDCEIAISSNGWKRTKLGKPLMNWQCRIGHPDKSDGETFGKFLAMLWKFESKFSEIQKPKKAKK